jgi:hypothetical protein
LPILPVYDAPECLFGVTKLHQFAPSYTATSACLNDYDQD